MARISKLELVEHKIGEWKAGDLAYIMRLDYQCRGFGQPAVLILEGLLQPRVAGVPKWPSRQAPWHQIALKFTGVGALKLTAGSGPIQVMGFEIADISDRGWEGINFLVDDYENGIISFTCRQVEILSVQSNIEFPGPD